jgi:DNA-binding SARP family transcriptional activator
MWGRSYVMGSPVAESLGMARRGAGDLDGAAEAFRSALAWADHAGAAGFAARSRVGLASVLADHDPEREHALDEAERAATRLGLGLVLAEVDRLRGRAEPTAPASPDAAAGPLRARVRTLGRFEVLGAGAQEPARWSSRKARDALKVLIARRGRSMPREELMDLLWPEVEVAVARSRLSVVLSMIRTALDPLRRLPTDPLRADRQSVALDLSLVDVDLEAFFTATALALAAVERDDPAAADLVAAAAELADLGPFLAEDPYADWAAGTRSAVDRSRLELFRAAARHAAASPADAIGWWSRLVDADPDDDDGLRTLVALLDRAGRHGEAAARRQDAARRRRSLGLATD